MLITAAKLPEIRRLEAVSFRSFPSTSTYYNGSWAIRLTAGHPAKRLNSINPLDPGDCWEIKQRLEQEVRRFENFGRPVVFRLTPLAPVELIEHLNSLGWTGFDESVVMTVNLDLLDLTEATDRLPYKDTGHWVAAFLEMANEDRKLKPGLVEVIGAVRAQTGLFLHESNNMTPVCALRTVLDNELLGLFDIVTDNAHQRKGMAAALLRSALRWARHEGAKKAWLQVVVANQPAVSLYKSLGFRERYRYLYRCSSPEKNTA